MSRVARWQVSLRNALAVFCSRSLSFACLKPRKLTATRCLRRTHAALQPLRPYADTPADKLIPLILTSPQSLAVFPCILGLLSVLFPCILTLLVGKKISTHLDSRRIWIDFRGSHDNAETTRGFRQESFSSWN